MRNVTYRWPQSGHNFQKMEPFFPIFENVQGRPRHLPAFRYTPRYIGFQIEKFPEYLTRFRWIYDILGLEKLWDYLAEFGLILLNTGLGLLNRPNRECRCRLSWRLSFYEDFLELPAFYLLIDSALTAPSFGNLCIIISPSTLLYRVSLSHISIAHLECFLIFSIFNHIKKNSPNTVNFNLPGSDVVW